MIDDYIALSPDGARAQLPQRWLACHDDGARVLQIEGLGLHDAFDAAEAAWGCEPDEITVVPLEWSGRPGAVLVDEEAR